MNIFIVITSIYHPTEAIQLYANIQNTNVVVVGDRKTPEVWRHEKVRYISIKEQESSDYRIARKLPYNHYSRKMFGYLYAIKNGADIIIDADDDNIPLPDYAFPQFDGNYINTASNLGFINIYKHFTDEFIWPRGLPLQKISDRNQILIDGERDTKIGVWQGLANEDPDVDAIYRLTIQKPCFFLERAPITLGRNTVTPFNSQNTAFRKEIFPLLFLPSTVTFRFTDILRGIIAQPIMWNFGFQLGFVRATVLQKRNVHDYFKDFISEIPVYLHSDEVFQAAVTIDYSNLKISDSLIKVYREMLERKIVQIKELDILESWLEDIF
jgi:hypothetical protein